MKSNGHTNPKMLPLFGKATGRHAMRNRDANEVVKAVNKILNLIVKLGLRNELIVADGNAILSLNLRQLLAESGLFPTFRVVSVESDHYVCHSWDEENVVEGSTNYRVARPWEHRNSILSERINGTIHDYTYTSTTERESDNGTTTETQYITPPILLTDVSQPNPSVIVAMPCRTGVVALNDEEVLVPVTLLDMNIAGRAWATPAEEPPP